jgi:hypothetical protein
MRVIFPITCVVILVSSSVHFIFYNFMRHSSGDTYEYIAFSYLILHTHARARGPMYTGALIYLDVKRVCLGPYTDSN